MGHNNHRGNKGKMRSCLTGKIINGREVILVDEAEEYLKKMGYIIIKRQKDISFPRALEKAIGFIIFSLLLLPFISAQPDLFIMDFSLRQNQIILLLLFAISGVMYWKENYLFSGTLVLISGMLMAFNSINLVVSLFMFAIGIFILTQDGRE